MRQEPASTLALPADSPAQDSIWLLPESLVRLDPSASSLLPLLGAIWNLLPSVESAAPWSVSVHLLRLTATLQVLDITVDPRTLNWMCQGLKPSINQGPSPPPPCKEFALHREMGQACLHALPTRLSLHMVRCSSALRTTTS